MKKKRYKLLISVDIINVVSLIHPRQKSKFKTWGVFALFKKILSSLGGGKESIDELYDEIEVLREECDSLNDVIRQKDTKIKKLYAEIERLESQLSERDNSERIDQNLLDKLDQELKNRDLKIKELEDKNATMSHQLVSDITEEKIDEVLNSDLISYRVLINDYYEARKFESFKKLCEELGLVYVDQLESLDFSNLALTETKIKNAKSYFEEYRSGYYDLDLKNYLIKGDKISKIFFRFRSFVKYCKKSNLNYMVELETLNFESLLDEDFTDIQIEKIKAKIQEYNEVRKVKK